jgi:hypothetical protein
MDRRDGVMRRKWQERKGTRGGKIGNGMGKA